MLRALRHSGKDFSPLFVQSSFSDATIPHDCDVDRIFYSHLASSIRCLYRIELQTHQFCLGQNNPQWALLGFGSNLFFFIWHQYIYRRHSSTPANSLAVGTSDESAKKAIPHRCLHSWGLVRMLRFQ